MTVWLPDDKVRALITEWRDDGGDTDDTRRMAAEDLEDLINETQQPKSPPSIGSARCMAYGGEPEIEVTG